jgi:hypothetical protein
MLSRKIAYQTHPLCQNGIEVKLRLSRQLKNIVIFKEFEDFGKIWKILKNFKSLKDF